MSHSDLIMIFWGLFTAVTALACVFLGLTERHDVASAAWILRNLCEMGAIMIIAAVALCGFTLTAR